LAVTAVAVAVAPTLAEMRLGLFTAADPHHGGVYQYGLTMLEALEARASAAGIDELLILSDSHAHPPRALMDRNSPFVQLPDFSSPLVKYPFLLKAHEPIRWPRLLVERARIGRRSNVRPRAIQRQFALSAWLDRLNLDLMLYAHPAATAFETNVPYVFVVHDLQHRVNPQFPEFSANGEWDRREYLFRNGVARATVVVTPSETAKEDVLHYYGDRVSPEQVAVLPHVAPSYLLVDDAEAERERARGRRALPERYIFYPAQFWPHKNHAKLLEALAELRHGSSLDVPVVMTGSAPDAIRRRTLAETHELADSLGIRDLVHGLGYVDDREIAGLYLNATALVMPTFAATANIPVIEAWTLGCPVITSDIRGVREQVGSAALTVDPSSASAIADAIATLWTAVSQRERLVEAGSQRVREHHAPEQFEHRLTQILTTARAIAIDRGPGALVAERPPAGQPCDG
jgi:glycosyltransferase involved in cell wall biosynthesis